MKRNLLMCMFICCFGFIATACEKEKDKVINPIAMDEATRTEVVNLCNSLPIRDYCRNGGFNANEIIVIDSQEKLAELAPSFADKINLNGNTLLIVPVELTSGSAWISSSQLVRSEADKSLVFKVVTEYPNIQTFDMAVKFSYNLYPPITESVKLEIIRKE